MDILSDDYFMGEAIKEAKIALELDEVPVGAVIVSNNIIVAKAHNLVQRLKDSTAHAEMLAITAAFEYMQCKYLTGCTLYITLEPCVMCAGASYWAQIDKIVYGAHDEKRGYTNFSKSILHPKAQVISGVREAECSKLLTDFFKLKRKP